MKNNEKGFLKLFSSNPDAIDRLEKVSRFPLEKKSTIIFKEESLKDYNKKGSQKEEPKRKGVASFLLE